MLHVGQFALASILMLTVAAAAIADNRTTTVLVKTRAELQQAVANAKPGTKIAIAAGTYEGGLNFSGLHGSAKQPIILSAADASLPPVIEGGSFCLRLADPTYVELHNLVLTKGRENGLNIDDGGSAESPASHIVLKGLVVRDIGGSGNHDGIKLSGVDDFVVEKCVVERWGKRGSAIDMVGCHRGIISQNTFREGDEVDANGVQMKGGSSDVTLRYCRFDHAGGRAVNLGGSTGLPYFRPRPMGYEAKNIVVEDCTFMGSMAPVAFVGVDGATVRHNTFYRPTRWVMRILQENQDPSFIACRGGKFTRNIVAFQVDELAAAVNIGAKTAPETFQFAHNFWYAIGAPDRTRRAVQLPTSEADGVYGQDPKFRDPAKGDFQLTADSPAKGFGPRSARAEDGAKAQE